MFIEADRDGIARATYMPTLMNEMGQPVVVGPDDPQFAKSLEFLNWAGKFINGGVTQTAMPHVPPVLGATRAIKF